MIIYQRKRTFSKTMISLGKQLKQVDDLDLWCSVYLLDKNLLMCQVTTKPSISKQL